MQRHFKEAVAVCFSGAPLSHGGPWADRILLLLLSSEGVCMAVAVVGVWMTKS